MVTSVETYRAAFVMLEHWGKGAHAEAVRKMQVAQAIGDAQGCITWARVAHAIRDLERQWPCRTVQ
jgi:hypothetical protein